MGFCHSHDHDYCPVVDPLDHFAVVGPLDYIAVVGPLDHLAVVGLLDHSPSEKYFVQTADLEGHEQDRSCLLDPWDYVD